MFGRRGDCKQLFRPPTPCVNGLPLSENPSESVTDSSKMLDAPGMARRSHVQDQIRSHENRATKGWSPDSGGARAGTRAGQRSIRHLDGEPRAERAIARCHPSGKDIVAGIQPPLSEGTSRSGRGRSPQRANQKSRPEIYAAATPTFGEDANRHVALSLRRGRNALPSAFAESAPRRRGAMKTQPRARSSGVRTSRSTR